MPDPVIVEIIVENAGPQAVEILMPGSGPQDVEVTLGYPMLAADVAASIVAVAGSLDAINTASENISSIIAAPGAADASAEDASRSQAYAALSGAKAAPLHFASVANCIADNALSYLSGSGLVQVGTGDLVQAQGFRYQVASSGASDHHLTTAGGVKLYVLEMRVRPEMYGAVGDGSDENANLLKMADHARSRGYLDCILTSGKTYGYTQPSFLANIKTIRVEGNGAAFLNLTGTAAALPYAIHGEGLVFWSPFYTNGPDHYNGGSTPYNDGQIIDTVSANSTSFTVPSGAGTPECAAGDSILLYGFDAQNTASFPPCCAVFEWAKVSSVSGQTVSLDGPLANKYRSDWNENALGGVTYGPARFINLNRGAADYEEIESLHLENITIKRNPNWTHAYGTVERNGRLTIGGVREARLVNVEVEGGCYISSCESVGWYGGRIHSNMAFDKLTDHVFFEKIRINKVSEGIGTKFIHLKNCRIDTETALGARSQIHFEDCDIPLNDGTTAGGFNSTCLTPELRITGGRIRVTDSAKRHIVSPSEKSYAFTSPDANTLSIPLSAYVSNSLGRVIRPGLVITNDGEPAFEVGEYPYLSGSDVLIPGFTIGPFTPGSTSLAMPYNYAKVVIDDPIIETSSEQSVRPFTTNTIATPVYCKFIGLGYTEDSFTLTSEQLPSNLNEVSGSCYGMLGGLWRPERMMVDVHKAYTGTDEAPKIVFSEYNRTGSTYMTIDALTTGVRWVGIGGNSTALGTDTLAAFATTVMESWRVRPNPAYTDIDSSKAPRWAFTIYGRRKSGGFWI